MPSLLADAAWKLSPSDLTFLFEECHRCFWLKVVGNLPRPRAPFPKIFGLLDRQTKDFFTGKRTQDISPELSPGRVLCGDRWVRSRPLEIEGHRRKVSLRGRLDTALTFDDGTFGIVDFKTADPKQEHVGLYGRQLHCYAISAEKAAFGSLLLNPVTRTGLLCVEPISMIALGGGVAYRSVPTWVEVPRDDDSFIAFLSRVLDVLEQPSPPEASPDCRFCTYLLDGVPLLAKGPKEAGAR